MAPVVSKRPVLTVQCDWEEVLRVKDGTAWVSCKEIGKTSNHGKITCTSLQSSGLPEIQADNSFKVNAVSTRSLTISHEDPNSKCTFISVAKCFSNIHDKSIVSLDVTTKGLGVSACSENKLFVWDSQNGRILRTLEGHVWDVYNCRFFPSGLVILSAGADLQIKIWSAETGKCAVTLRGHTAAITDTCIVDRGRNIVSVSKDGSARLWDCGESHCLDYVARETGNINCCSVNNVDIDVGVPDETPNEREVNTDGKLLLLGCEDGTVRGVGLRSRKSIFEHKYASAINCCCFISKSETLFGAQDGMLYLFDLSNTSEPSIIWEESASAVTCLLPVKDGFFAGRADGSCTYVSLTNDITVQLTGPGFDPVYCIAKDESCIYTGCRDRLIRKYILPESTGISFR